MYMVSCYDVKDVHFSFSENIHLHKMYYISGRWRREEGAAAPMIKEVDVRGTLKSAIKSMHWKVATKQQVQLLFSIQKRANLYIQKGFFLIFKVYG